MKLLLRVGDLAVDGDDLRMLEVVAIGEAGLLREQLVEPRLQPLYLRILRDDLGVTQ